MSVNPQSVAQNRDPIGTRPVDAENPFFKYLGPPTGEIAPNPYDKVAFTNYDLPEAYKGKNLYVKGLITGLILAGNRWYTTLALPWAFTNQQSFRWNEWHFNRTLAGRVPHEGVSRLVTSSKREFRDRVTRRGLAFVMEVDYFGTPEGDEMYRRNIQGIVQSVQETQDHDVVFALLMAKQYQKAWQYQWGTLPLTYRKIVDQEIKRYASAARPDGRALELIYEQEKRVMLHNGITPDMLIVTPGMGIYLSMVPPGKTEYWIAGEDGVRSLKEGPRSMATFRDGTNVQETRDFIVDESGTPIQLLTRHSQIAEYNPMVFGEWRNESLLHGKYMTRWRDIVIFDENRNDWAKISFVKAFEHAKIFDNSGKYARALKAHVDMYNAEGRRNPGSTGPNDDDDEDDDDMGASAPGDGKWAPVPFAAMDGKGIWQLIKYFGQMNKTSATATDFRQAGETLAAKMADDIDTWHDLMRLLNEIESQPYDHAFFTALVRANTASNIDEDDTFIGEMTPRELIAHWGLDEASAKTALREWRPNQHGSLNLPRGADVAHMRIPPGYANGPGLLTLAAEAARADSPWHDIGVRASDAVNMLLHMINVMKQIMPECEFVQEKNRDPWFHRADALTVFVANLVSVSRHPMWLAHLPAVTDAEGKVRGATSGARRAAAGGDRDICWFAVPGLIVDLPAALEAGDVDTLIDAIRRAAGGEAVEGLGVMSGAPGTDEGTVLMWSPTLGRNISVPVALFTHSAMMTREVRSVALMPEGGAERRVLRAHIAILQTIGDVDNYEGDAADRLAQRRDMRDKYMSFVFKYASGKNRDIKDLWRIIMAIDMKQQLEGAAGAFGAIESIYMTPSYTRQQQAAARAAVKALMADAERIADIDSAVAGNPLYVTWEQGGPFGPGAFSAGPGEEEVPERVRGAGSADIGADADRILELYADLSAASGVETPADPFTEETVAEFATAVRAAAPGSDAEVNELLRLVRTVRARVTAAGGNLGLAAERTVRRYPGARVDVIDTAGGLANAVYYRSPLTMSLSMLESLSEQFCDRETKPLVLPSDASAHHLQPYVLESGARTGDLPGSVWKNPSYATIGKISADDDGRPLEHMAFVSRHVVPEAVANLQRSAVSGAGGGGSGLMLSDDEFSDDDGDDFARVFGGKSAKRARTSSAMDAPFIGYGHMDYSAAGRSDMHKADPRARMPFAGRGGGKMYSAEYHKTFTDDFMWRWDEANKISNPFVRIATQAILATPCSDKKVWMRMMDNNVHVPINIILWRMDIVHEMASVILMKGGLETGASFYGHSNFATGHDAVSKIIYGNFTFNSKPVVYDSRGVHVIENIKPEGYLGGSNTEFVRSRRDMRSRTIDRQSIVATVVGITENKFPTMLSFTGKVHVPDVNEAIDGPGRLQYSTAAYYDSIYGIGDMSTSKPLGDDYFLDRARRFTPHAFPGTQANFNGSTRIYDRWFGGQGHRGQNVYRGCADVWNGTMESFREQRLEEVKIE